MQDRAVTERAADNSYAIRRRQRAEHPALKQRTINKAGNQGRLVAEEQSDNLNRRVACMSHKRRDLCMVYQQARSGARWSRTQRTTQRVVQHACVADTDGRLQALLRWHGMGGVGIGGVDDSAPRSMQTPRPISPRCAEARRLASRCVRKPLAAVGDPCLWITTFHVAEGVRIMVVMTHSRIGSVPKPRR